MTQTDDGTPTTTSEISDTVPRLPDVGVWEHRLPEDHVMVSDGFCHLLGLDPSQVNNDLRFWDRHVHPDDLQRYRAAYQAFLTGRTPQYEALYRVRHQDGRWVSVLARSRWDHRDGPGKLARGYVMDVTWSERIKLQAEIIERMSEGVLLLARDGVIHFANTVAEVTLGYAPGGLTGLNAQQLSFRSREAVAERLQTAFDATENGASALIDLEMRRHDGSLLPLQGRFSGLQLGTTRHVVVVFSDVSSGRQIEREMMKMATQMQVRVGGDLHEGLGQQLFGIAMMLQALAERASSGTVVARNELDEVVTLLNAAVNHTRLLARGLSPVRPSERGLREGFEELVNNVRQVYGKRAHLTLDLPAGLVVDESCATAIFHIAQEAVENAARHSGAADIHISFRLTGSDLELQVSDDGVGFDPARIARPGLGLRVMRFRAEMARGYLSIESRPGHGARLRCRCPARTDHHA